MAGSADSDQGLLKNTMTSITKQRVKLNIKVLGVQLGDQKDPNAAPVQGSTAKSATSQAEKQTFREQFKAPEMSIVSKLMAKVSKNVYKFVSKTSTKI